MSSEHLVGTLCQHVLYFSVSHSEAQLVSIILYNLVANQLLPYLILHLIQLIV